MNNVENQISRMKAMMSFGLQTENKNNYSSVEYHREGADGKMYGIVREGTKYYVKVAPKNSKLLKEDFEYIGGFRNRKNNEFHSYASALKNFDMKMSSLRESTGNKNVIIESWNPNTREQLAEAATERMRMEIARQRQIMGNASMISEGKACECGNCCTPKTVSYAEVNPKCANGNPFCEDPKTPEGTEKQNTEKNNIGKAQAPVKGKAVKESAEPLAWHKEGGNAQETIADTYMDTSHGTEIGDGAPFEKSTGSTEEAKNGVVEEGTSMAMDCGDNQNNPTPGVGEIGDDAPFDTKAKNGLQEAEEGEEVLDDEDAEGEDVDFDDAEGEDVDFDGDFDDAEGEDADFDSDLDDESGDEEGEDDVEARLSKIEDMLSSIMDKIGASDFDDDTLYDDAEPTEDAEDEFEIDLNDDVELGDDEFPEEDVEDDIEVFESRSYRRMRMMNEDKLDYFGKHPAYRKEPLQLPTHNHSEFPDYYDMNDDSVKGDQPYGEKIGSSAPFEIDPQAIDNAIAESINRMFRK